ncbi:kinesin [Penicillium odoratum]|uniref:kinesin n=1 Tax=Penicillium odoratum TaxID=1167516 RepID=UPI00254844D8|nr:kinesin [Penicillium odoratum]KAJ5765679.1 kinesin [Penicillium odoratum]
MSISFGGSNAGFQVGVNNGFINPTFHMPSGDDDSPLNPNVSIPFSRNTQFIADQFILDQLHEKLSVPGSKAALVGMGGVGKSQLALEYCYQILDRSPDTRVFWVCASNTARLEQSYRDLADFLRIPHRSQPDTNIFQLVQNWIQDWKQNWVLILDDIMNGDILRTSPPAANEDGTNDEYNALKSIFRSFESRDIRGTILMTTRNREISRSIDKCNTIQVNTMSEPLALALLENLLLESAFMQNEAKMLIRAAGYHPLTIVHVARCIISRYSLFEATRFLEILQEHQRNSLSHEVDSPPTGFRSAIRISFDNLQDTCPASMNLLFLMSFFDPNGFTKSLLKRSSNEVDRNADDTFESDFYMLKKNSLVVIGKNRQTFFIHELLQHEIKIRLEEHGQIEQWRKQFVINLSREFPTIGLDTGNRKKCQSLFPHLKAAMAQLPNSSSEESLLEWAELLQKGAQYATVIGGTLDMKEMARKAMEVRERLLGQDDQKTMDSCMTLIRAYILERELKRAENLAESLIPRSTRALGAENRTSLTAMDYLALIKWHQGHWQEAEVLNLKVLGIRKERFGPEHLDTVTSMNNLGLTYWNQGRWQEAESLQSRILEVRRQSLGPNNPDTLTSMNNLATTYWNQGRWRDAEILGKEVLDARVDLLGPQHPDTLTSMNNLALVYRDQGRLVDAEALSVQVLESYVNLQGRGHQNTLGSMENLASNYRNQGRWTEAQALQTEVLKAREKLFGHNHPDTLTSLTNLATTYWNEGRFEDAERLQKRALQTSQNLFGREHPDVLSRMSDLALTYQSQVRMAEAEELLLRVLKSQKAQLGQEHPDTLHCMRKLASIYLEQGQLDTAESLQVDALARGEKVLGMDHPTVLSNMNALASIYRSQGRLDDAEDILSRAMGSYQRVLGPEHPETVNSMENLALIAFGKQEWNKAETLERMVKNIRMKIFREDHPETLKAIKLLNQFARQNLAEEKFNLDDSLSDFSDSGSVISSFSYTASVSTNPTLDQPIAMTGVEVLTASLLKNENFQNLCKSALLERQIPRGRVHRNLRRLLRLFASHLGQGAQAGEHANTIKFVRSASSRIASRILQSPGIVNIPGAVYSTLDILKWPAPGPRLKSPPNAETLDELSRIEEVESESESGMSEDEFEVQEATILDDIQRLEDFLFTSNAFQVMERKFFDFVYPSLRSKLMKWITKERRLKRFTPELLRDLEVVVSELQHIAVDQILTCGELRWAKVPLSFAKRVTGASKTLAQSNAAASPSSQMASSSQDSYPSVPGQSDQDTAQNHQNSSWGRTPTHSYKVFNRPTTPEEDKPDLHIFLVMKHWFWDSFCLSQTSVKTMTDYTFFTWMRATYYSRRGFLLEWFGISKYSHCEFYKCTRFAWSKYEPLKKEYPSDEPSYHYRPKPLDPVPPMSPHQFRHFFEDQAWHFITFRRLAKIFSTAELNDTFDEHVNLLPKRDSVMEERDYSREVFWGLYVFEIRSVFMLVFYSFLFMTPSIYFFFAWLFQWGHHGDLQNASVLPTLSLMLVPFWGYIIFSSPGFDPSPQSH